MDVYKRYFVVKEGPLLCTVADMREINAVAQYSYSEIIKEIGAKEGYYQVDNRLVSFVFDTLPDTKVYKKAHKGWYPKKSNKEGKLLAARLDKIKTATDNDCLPTINLSGFPTIFSGYKCYNPTILILPTEPTTCLVQVPWYDEDLAKIERYKANRKNSMERNMDAILWEPTAHMVEVKGWEFEKILDDYNESVRADNKKISGDSDG